MIFGLKDAATHAIDQLMASEIKRSLAVASNSSGFKVPEQYRVKKGMFASNELDGNNGMFIFKEGQIEIRCIASDGMGWEHVSVSLSVKRTPDWDEMCKVKDLFWSKYCTVVQFHPPESEYVNNHAYCLHLWRKKDQNFEMPDSIMVGINSIGVLK